MKNGWNHQYFLNKKKQLEEKLQVTTDFTKRKQLEGEIDLCYYLTSILLFSQGEVFYDKVTMHDFAEQVCNQDFSYPIPENEQKRLEETAVLFSKLPKLNIKKDHTHITVDDSIQIVGDFLKDKFSNAHYQLFKDTFIHHSNYVLLDKNADESNVAYLDGEIFVRIAATENIKMLSSIAHEAGHVYRIANNHQNILNHPYQEYESFFYECNLLLWLMKNHMYSLEATNYFLQLFDVLEKVSYMRYLIQNHALNQIESSKELEKAIRKLHMMQKLHLRKNRDLFEIYLTALEINLQVYFNSFMAVLNHMDDFEMYEQIIKTIKPRNEEEIRANFLNGNCEEYSSYLKCRTFLQRTNR